MAPQSDSLTFHPSSYLTLKLDPINLPPCPSTARQHICLRPALGGMVSLFIQTSVFLSVRPFGVRVEGTERAQTALSGIGCGAFWVSLPLAIYSDLAHGLWAWSGQVGAPQAPADEGLHPLAPALPPPCIRGPLSLPGAPGSSALCWPHRGLCARAEAFSTPVRWDHRCQRSKPHPAVMPRGHEIET